MRETKLALTVAEGSRNDVHWMIKLSVRKLWVHKLSVHHSRNAKYIDGFRMILKHVLRVVRMEALGWSFRIYMDSYRQCWDILKDAISWTCSRYPNSIRSVLRSSVPAQLGYPTSVGSILRSSVLALLGHPHSVGSVLSNYYYTP